MSWYELVVPGIFTLLGALVGALIAGRITLKSTLKQIMFLKENEEKNKKDNYQKTLLVIKNYLERPLVLLKEILNDPFLKGFNQFNGDYTKAKLMIEDIQKAKDFIGIQAYNMDPNYLEDIYLVINYIDEYLGLYFEFSSESSEAKDKYEKMSEYEQKLKVLLEKLNL